MTLHQFVDTCAIIGFLYVVFFEVTWIAEVLEARRASSGDLFERNVRGPLARRAERARARS